LRRLARAPASARAAAADAVAGRADTNAARVARAPNVRAVVQRRPRPRGRGGGSDEAAIRIAPESSGAPPGTGVDAPPTRRTRSRCTARTLARAAAAAALASGADMDVSAPHVARDASRVAAAVSARHATRAWSAPAAASCGPRGRNGGVAAAASARASARTTASRGQSGVTAATAAALAAAHPAAAAAYANAAHGAACDAAAHAAAAYANAAHGAACDATAHAAAARAAALAATRHAIAAHAAAARRCNTAFSAPRSARGSRGRNSAAAAPGDKATSAPHAARASGARAKRDRCANQSPVECIVKDVDIDIVFASVADAQAQNETPRELLDQADNGEGADTLQLGDNFECAATGAAAESNDTLPPPVIATPAEPEQGEFSKLAASELDAVAAAFIAKLECAIAVDHPAPVLRAASVDTSLGIELQESKPGECARAGTRPAPASVRFQIAPASAVRPRRCQRAGAECARHALGARAGEALGARAEDGGVRARAGGARARAGGRVRDRAGGALGAR